MRKRFTCSYNRIELVITYSCNMRCNNCDAMVPQAPSKESMTVEQIEKFIKESIDKGVQWRHIRILGGEPSLHKDIFKFLELLIQYKNTYSPETRIQLVSNGHGKAVKEILSKVPKDVEIENSQKTSNIQPTFSTVNVAPIDLPEHKDSDFSKGCWIPSLCGITLDPHGYYPCSASAAIDRVFGYNLGKKELPTHKGELESVLENFCKLCGHFYDKVNKFAPNDIITQENVNEFEVIHNEKFPETLKDNAIMTQVNSPTWDKALKEYKQKRPVLSRY